MARCLSSVYRSSGCDPLGIYIQVLFCTTRLRLLRLQHLYRLRVRTSQATAEEAWLTPRSRPSLRPGCRVLGPTPPAVCTIFVGGGTPTLCPG